MMRTNHTESKYSHTFLFTTKTDQCIGILSKPWSKTAKHHTACFTTRLKSAQTSEGNTKAKDTTDSYLQTVKFARKNASYVITLICFTALNLGFG